MGKFIQDCADCDGYCNCFRHPEIYKARQTSDRKIVLSRQIFLPRLMHHKKSLQLQHCCIFQKHHNILLLK